MTRTQSRVRRWRTQARALQSLGLRDSELQVVTVGPSPRDDSDAARDLDAGNLNGQSRRPGDSDPGIIIMAVILRAVTVSRPGLRLSPTAGVALTMIITATVAVPARSLSGAAGCQ